MYRCLYGAMSKNNPERPFQYRWLWLCVILAAVSCAAAWCIYESAHHQERRRAAAVAKYEHFAECIASGESTPALCKSRAEYFRYDQSAEFYDLKAQQEMAQWAALMLIVTSVGVLFVAATLITASDANKVFSISAERQSRAYISIHQLSFLEANVSRPPGAVLRILNSGNSPANKVYVWYRIGLRPMENLEPRQNDFNETERGKWDKTIGPQSGSTVTASLSDVLTQEQYIAMIAKQIAIVMWGEVHYEDIFEKQQVTRFCYYYAGNPNEAGKSMSAWHTGNSAT